MVQILLPEALYVVTTSAPWATIASHRYWSLELELRVDDTRLPLRNVESDTAVQHLSGSLLVTSILPVDGSDFHAVAVGNQLVAVNGVELDGLDVLEMHLLLRAATDTAPTHLLFLRHDYADANVALHLVRPPLSSPFELTTFTHNDVTWYFSPSYTLYADDGHPKAVAYTSRAWQLWRETQTRLRTSLYSWDEIVMALEDKIWQHFCALLLDESLWPEMKIPYIAHLNLNSDARDALYCEHFTTSSAQTWGLELAAQAPYALTTTPLSSTSKGIVVVTKVPHAQDRQLAVMVGDILVAINHTFLTTAIPSALKKLKRVASHASPLRPASLLFLRYEHFGIARHLTPATALSPSQMTTSDLLSSLYPPALDMAIAKRLPLQVDALQWLFSQANAFTTHCIQNQLWYAHRTSKRVFAEHPLRIVLYPVVEAARRRLLWTVRWVEWRWQRRLRLLAAVDAMQNRVVCGLLEAAIDVCIQRIYAPVVIDYTRQVVDSAITSVLDDLVQDEEQIFVSSLRRFRRYNGGIENEPALALEATTDRRDTEMSTSIRPPTPLDAPRIEPVVTMVLLTSASFTESNAMPEGPAAPSDNVYRESQWVEISDAAMPLDKLPVRAWNDGHARAKKKLPRRKPTLRQITAATRIQACFRGFYCRITYRIKRDKLRRRAEARTRLGALSPFLNERSDRFPRLPTRTVQGGRTQPAPPYDEQESEMSLLRTQLTDREEEIMEDLKALNHALESRRKVHVAPRLPLLSKTTSFGSK
ncbi:hypothetical protein SDRG_04517, partial [Saprolegnia diclina VS20]